MENNLGCGAVALRALEPTDVDLLYRWENDPAVWKISSTVVPFSRFVLNEFIQSAHSDIYETKQLRLIIQTCEGKAIGCVDLFDFEPVHARAGVGILIYSEEDRKQGYATDALKAVASYCKNYLHLHQLFADVGINNSASIRLFETVGYVRSGVKKEWQQSKDGWEDVAFFQLFL